MHYAYTILPKIQNYRQRPAYTIHCIWCTVYDVYEEKKYLNRKTAFSIEISSWFFFFGFGIFGTGCCFVVENEHMYEAGSVNCVNV